MSSFLASSTKSLPKLQAQYAGGYSINSIPIAISEWRDFANGEVESNGNEAAGNGCSDSTKKIDVAHNNDGQVLNNSAREKTHPLATAPVEKSTLEAVTASAAGEARTISRYSRKVFVGGLPPDIDECALIMAFRNYGGLRIDWPQKREHQARYPPKGYAFIVFQDERSVHYLLNACVVEDEKYYLFVSSSSIANKPVQIRPWRISDAECLPDPSVEIDPRKTVFVGGVPRTLKAAELAMIMKSLFGNVCHVAIDTDAELKYPKGAARVNFSSKNSYVRALTERFVQLQHGDVNKRVEIKPYVMQNQRCDQHLVQGPCASLGLLFCPSLSCLKYYCTTCWGAAHVVQGRELHKPIIKEGNERPRAWPLYH